MPPVRHGGPILRFGSRSEFVRTLQLRIESLGFSAGAIDGIYGQKTENAVRKFQSAHRLTVDGVVGPKTRAVLGLDVLGQASVVPGLSCWVPVQRPADSYRNGGFTANALIQGYDAQIRMTQYVRPAESLAEQILRDVTTGKLSHTAGREKAHAQRNNLLKATREKLSPGGREFSKAIKEEGKTLSELLHKYSRMILEKNPSLMNRYGLKTLDPKSPLFRADLYERAVEELARSEQVSMEIIKASGRTGKVVTAVAKFSRVAGPLGTVAGLAISAYEISAAPSEQRAFVVGREASGFAGGLLGSVGGGLAAGWAASLLCGPAAPVCGIAVSVVVVGASAWTGGTLFEKGYEWILR